MISFVFNKKILSKKGTITWPWNWSSGKMTIVRKLSAINNLEFQNLILQ